VLTENNTRQGFFERPDLEAVVAALPDDLRDFTRFAYLTGWRKGEITSLKWTDVDRDAGAIRLRPEAAKTGRGRTVMLEGDLAELIDRRWEARLLEKNGNVQVTALVFHRDGKPIADFKKSWATACEVAGVPDKLFHDLRRTAARNMVRAGVPERVAMAARHPEHVRPLQHRQRGRSPNGGAEDDDVRGHAGEDARYFRLLFLLALVVFRHAALLPSFSGTCSSSSRSRRR
jgi:integrase